MRQLVLIAHNIRSTHNVGAIFRTSEGFGVKKIIFTGYTPYPSIKNDERPPHIRNKITTQIAKTALGAEKMVNFEYTAQPAIALKELKSQGYVIAALEQTPKSITLSDYANIPDKLVLLLGEEVRGITNDLLNLCDVELEIPMVGKKESFNVSVATGIAIYALTCVKKI